MPILILGLVIFLGAHSIRKFADGWRTRTIALIGVVLIVVGFGQARHTPELLYLPPRALKDLNGLFTLVAFVLFGASHAPPTHYKAWLHHPMVAGAGLWAFGHLLATGFLHDVVLFGAFLAWAIVDFAAARRRDRVTNTVYAPGTLRNDLITFVIGLIVWAIFAFLLHGPLIGVQPFGNP